MVSLSKNIVYCITYEFCNLISYKDIELCLGHISEQCSTCSTHRKTAFLCAFQAVKRLNFVLPTCSTAVFVLPQHRMYMRLIDCL